MQRIIGTEVEYGISSPSDPTANPILTSTQAVLAYAAAAGIQRAKRTRWDYEVESPLRDARGFDLSRSAGPPPIIDADEVGAANMILTNGARLYVDHAHPEYSAPEVTDPLDAVIWDKAGERVMEAAARHVASVPGAAKLQLYKNNVDGKGASYGSHENYLMSRQTPFSAVISGLTPFMVSRQVVTGSGRVGIGLCAYGVVQLVALIAAGQVGDGDWLPSTRALAQDLGASRTMVAAAYDELVAAGFLEGVPGAGTRTTAGATAASASVSLGLAATASATRATCWWWSTTVICCSIGALSWRSPTWPPIECASISQGCGSRRRSSRPSTAARSSR